VISLALIAVGTACLSIAVFGVVASALGYLHPWWAIAGVISYGGLGTTILAVAIALRLWAMRWRPCVMAKRCFRKSKFTLTH
jgi:protein-S-isoprenylcysteine O-methyltransferase Ste14